MEAAPNREVISACGDALLLMDWNARSGQAILPNGSSGSALVEHVQHGAGSTL